MADRYGIATLVQGAEAIASLETIGCVQEPRGDWNDGERRDLSDGSVRFIGYPVATWIFTYIQQASRDALRDYCAGASAEVYVRTINNEEVFKIYRAIMRWPEEKGKPQWRRSIKFDFRVQFLILEEAEIVTP